MSVKKTIGFRIIGIIILVWLLLRVDLKSICIILGNSSRMYLWGALLCLFLHVLLKFMRYQYILTQQAVHQSFLYTFQVSMASIYLSFITPGRVGELSKAFFIHKSQGVGLKRLLAGSVLDRLYDVYILIFTALVGTGFVIKPDGLASFPLILTLVGIALVPLLLFIPVIRHLCLALVSWLPGKIQKTSGIYDQLNGFMKELDLLMSWKLLWGLGWSVFAYGIFFYACSLMGLAVGVSLPFFTMAFIVAWVNIASFLPISFAGIGTREACLVYFFSREGLSNETALAFSAVMFTLTYVFFGIIGFIAFVTLKHKGDPREERKG